LVKNTLINQYLFVLYVISVLCLWGGGWIWGVGAKANVLQWVGFERWDEALLIYLKRWNSVFHFSGRFLSVVSSFRVRHISKIDTIEQNCK
jgi:hypothetical protein